MAINREPRTENRERTDRSPLSALRSPTNSNPKIAIVHDWLYGGGAEKVVLELHHVFPDAPIYTSYCSDEWRAKLDGKVVTGYLQNWPFSSLRKFLPALRQRWFSKLDLSDFDLVISSSGNGEAKFAKPRKDAKHICYCHTPTHFYWRHYGAYMKNPGFGPKPLVRLGLKWFVEPLKRHDYEAAQAVDLFLANSHHIQDDITRYYNRESTVVYPPVDVERFAAVQRDLPRKGYVTMGRQVPQKKVELIIAACNELQLPLTVIGRGPEHEALRAIAGSTIAFKTDVTDEQMPGELARAEAFIFAAEEDFGIAPVEALAAGTPVIAYQAGGALDYVIPGKTGELFAEQSVASLVAALKAFRPKAYNAKTIQEQTKQFSIDTFHAQIKRIVEPS